MNALEKRLQALETASGAGGSLVVLIRSFAGEVDEPIRIVSTAGAEWLREPEETAEAFRARAEAGPHGKAFVVLREYNRATPDVKQWARYDLQVTAPVQ